MRFPIDRLVCSSCKLSLPRAAVRRCPHCLTPTELTNVLLNIVCRACNRALPRAHAGKCPSCALAVGERTA